jgi:DNA-binding CsgD family transcriptional regulator
MLLQVIYFNQNRSRKNGVVVKFTIKTVSKYKNNSFKKNRFNSTESKQFFVTNHDKI